MPNHRGPPRPRRKGAGAAGRGTPGTPRQAPAAAPATGGSIAIPGVIPQLPHHRTHPAPRRPFRDRNAHNRIGGAVPAGPASSQPVPDTGIIRRTEPPGPARRSRHPTGRYAPFSPFRLVPGTARTKAEKGGSIAAAGGMPGRSSGVNRNSRAEKYGLFPHTAPAVDSRGKVKRCRYDLPGIGHNAESLRVVSRHVSRRPQPWPQAKPNPQPAAGLSPLSHKRPPRIARCPIRTDGGWCPRRDSNSHALRRRILNPLRLPFRHSGPGHPLSPRVARHKGPGGRRLRGLRPRTCRRPGCCRLRSRRRTSAGAVRTCRG